MPARNVAPTPAPASVLASAAPFAQFKSASTEFVIPPVCPSRATTERTCPLANCRDPELKIMFVVPGDVKMTWYAPAATDWYPVAEGKATLENVGVVPIPVPEVTM